MADGAVEGMALGNAEAEIAQSKTFGSMGKTRGRRQQTLEQGFL